MNCHGLSMGVRKPTASTDAKPQAPENANTAYATTWCFLVWVRRLTKRQTAHLDRVTARISKISLAYIAYIALIGSVMQMRRAKRDLTFSIWGILSALS